MAHATSHDMAKYGNFQISMTCNGLARFNELQDIFMDMFERYVLHFSMTNSRMMTHHIMMKT